MQDSYTRIKRIIIYCRLDVKNRTLNIKPVFIIAFGRFICYSIVDNEGQYATSRKVAGSIPAEVTGFYNWPNISSRTMTLGSTKPLTETNTRNIPEGKGRSASKADNLTVTCQQIVEKMWKPRRLTTLRV
jgi:hypothetical protein